MSNRRLLIIFSIFTAAVLFAGVAFISFEKEVRNPKLRVYGRVNDFVLKNADNKDFGSKELSGRVWIANFFFTTCSGVCPILQKNFTALKRTFEQIPGVSLVSITVNPEQDTPDVLKKYKQAHDALNAKWHFLTGKRSAIRDLVVGNFKLGSIKDPIFHSDKFVLVDRHGYIRGYYEGTKDEGRNQIFMDAVKLLKER